MRISELSVRAGLPVGTIKFYLRSGLLHHGQLRSTTQAAYDHSHLDRLRLVRALLEVGRLSHAEIQAVLGALTARDEPLGERVVRVHEAAAQTTRFPPADLTGAQRVVDQLGWQIDPTSPHLARLASAVEALEAVGLPASDERMRAYAEAAAGTAADDIDWIFGRDDAADQDAECDDAVLRAVGGAVLWGSVLAALRMLAGEHAFRRRFGDPRSSRRRVPAPRDGSETTSRSGPPQPAAE